MNRVAAMLGLVRRQAGRSGAAGACIRLWGRGSVVAVLLTLSLVLLGEGTTGDLDSTSGGGTVTTDFGGDDVVAALVLQPDGKLVAAGCSFCGTSVEGIELSTFALARYLPDGRLDPKFGDQGKVTGSSGGALALLLQPDGNLVAAGGSCLSFFGCDDFVLVRYLPDGSLDPTFGVGGTVTMDFGGEDVVRALVLQPDGKLVAAGLIEDRWGLARFLPDGRLDSTFGVGGIVKTFEWFEVADLVLQPDGKLVAAGQINANWGLARYLPDGSLDPTFGVGGIVTTTFDFGGLPSALVLQPDGKPVAAGFAFVPDVIGTCCDFALASYLPDGSLDPSFGTGGKMTTDFGGGDGASALILQPDGKLVAAGEASFNFALARYLPDGSLDPTFGTGGRVTTHFAGSLVIADALVLQPDGKLVAAGQACTEEGGLNACDFALARYRPDGSLDASFGTGFEINVNALVTFEPIESTFTFTPDPTGCPEGFVGTFSFEARLTNSSESTLTDLVVAVTTLTNGNLLHNADGGPGGVGARLTVPQRDGFSDGVLSPEEFVEVPFVICLTQQQPFQFVVDVLGVVGASSEAHAKAPLAR